ncbi:MAG: hypothetical protein IKC40_04605 [Oscillospiraceae bacterium]|nr:hypothetical protein [Oscillospiraceae bacterium]MBR6618210.1 hypothetical protein [Oscillospiraceae bacterium]
MKKFLTITIASALLLSLTACGEEEQSSGASDTKSTTAETLPEVPEGAIVDESGTFVFTGPLRQGGDDENGYIKVPIGFLSFQEEGVEGLTQYASMDGTTIITLDRYEGYDYKTVANNFRYYFEEDENVEGLGGATTVVNGYNALQLYCHYKDDGKYFFAWMIEDPANPQNSYYLAMEFLNEDKNIVACSSTFQTVEDFAKTQETQAG